MEEDEKTEMDDVEYGSKVKSKRAPSGTVKAGNFINLFKLILGAIKNVRVNPRTFYK